MLDFLAAFLTAALSATGVGGGGLLILYLRLVRNIPQVTSQGINLIFFTVILFIICFLKRKIFHIICLTSKHFLNNVLY